MAGRKTTKTKRRTTATTAKTRKKTSAKRSTKKTVVSALRSKLTKSQLTQHIADATDLTKKQVAAVMDELGVLMHRSLKKGGIGEFTVPGLVKCVVKRKPATKARKGINPFTGEEMVFKAKPARNVVKVRPLKKLKEMVE